MVQGPKSKVQSRALGARASRPALWFSFRRCCAMFLLLALTGLPQQAGAAWGSVGTLGSAQSKTADQSSAVLTTSAAAEAGNVVVLIVAVDNNQTADGDEGAVTSVTDSAGGNTWTKGVEFCNGQGTAQTGATVSIWFSKLTNQINSGGTITANLSNNTSRDASAMSAWEYTIGAGNIVTVEVTNTLAGDGNDPQSLNATTPNAEFLRVRGIAGETNNTIQMTATGSWTLFSNNQTSGGGAASNMAVRGEFRINTATSAASDPAWTSLDNANGYVALKEAAAPPPRGRRLFWFGD